MAGPPRRRAAPLARSQGFGSGSIIALGLLVARASAGHIHVVRPNATTAGSPHPVPTLPRNASAIKLAGSKRLANSSAETYLLSKSAAHSPSATSTRVHEGAREDPTALANSSRLHKGSHASKRSHTRNGVVFLDDGLEDYAPLGTSLLGDAAHVDGAERSGTSLLFTGGASSGGTARNNLSEGVAEGRGRGLHLGNSTLQADAAKKQKLTPQSWFAITFSFAFVVKCLCMLSNVVFQVSPLPQVLKFNVQGDTLETDAAPFMSILYGGCQWCFYGFFAFLVTQKSGFLVLVYSNVMGAVLGSYYIWVFQRNCISEASIRKLNIYYRIAAFMVIIQLIAMAVLTRVRALFFCGTVSSICSIIGATSLLATLPTVLETKSSKTINKPILVAGFFGAVLWALCGFILWDPLIMVPNLVCMCFQTIAFGLVIYFPGDGPPSPGACESSPRATLEAAEDLQTRFWLPAAGAKLAASKAVPNYGSVEGETGGTF